MFIDFINTFQGYLLLSESFFLYIYIYICNFYFLRLIHSTILLLDRLYGAILCYDPNLQFPSISLFDTFFLIPSTELTE